MQEDNLLPPPQKDQILATFLKYGFTSKSFINRIKLESILNTQHKRVFSVNLEPQVIEQMWSEVEANSRGEIIIDVICDIILQAEGILRQRIKKLSGQDGMISETQINIIDKKSQLAEYKQYYSDQPYKINQMTKQLIKLELKQKQQQYELQNFKAQHLSIRKIFSPEVQAYSKYRKQATIYHEKSSITDKKSKQLLFVFHLTWLLILIEMLLLDIRVSMLTIGVYLWSIYTILFANHNQYQNQRNASGNINKPEVIINYWIIAAIISIIADIIYCILKFVNKFLLMPILHTSNSVYYEILLMIIILTIVLRVVMILFYGRIRSKLNKQNLFFQLFGYRIYLFDKNNLQLNTTNSANKSQYLQS